MDASSKLDCGMTSLGLSIDLSISVQSQQQQQQQEQQQQQQQHRGVVTQSHQHQQHHHHHHPSEYFSKRMEEERITPLQLDLLPRPVAQKKNAALLWQSLFSKSRAETSDSNAAEAPNSSISFSKGLDMNQIPCLAESEEGGGGVSAATSFQLMEPSSRRLDAKREREVEEGEQTALPRAASDEEEGGTRKKLRLSKEQSALLEESFREHSTLNPKQKNALAKQLNLRPRQVEVWFQNRRARTKLKQTEVDCELLKKYCEGLSEENRRLQKELQELRALKISPPCVIAHDFYMPLPATTLTMCPSCERLAAVDNSSNNNNASSITNRSSHHQTAHHTTATNNNNKQPTPSFHTNSNSSNTVPPPRFTQPSLLQSV